MAKKDVDAYISAQAEPERTLLKQMRQIIMEVEPSLKQVISYGIPAFKLDGDVVCGIAARKSGCSFYPFSSSVLAALQTDLVTPARRALVDARLYKVSDLRKISQQELEDLHGMGKSAIARLKVLMNAKKIKFRP